jgi:hypothetical protein
VSLFLPLSRSYTLTKVIYIADKRQTVSQTAEALQQPDFLSYIRKFLYEQLHPEGPPSSEVPPATYPTFHGLISVYHSATATYYAPSDSSGCGGMHRERIHARESWRQGPARYDCALVNLDPDMDGMRGLAVVRVRRFFSIAFETKVYACAFVHWYSAIGDDPDEDTGMWKVKPDFNADGTPLVSVLHLDCILRSAHLIPVYGVDPVPKQLTPDYSLDHFSAFYVNKYIDHHAFVTAF